MKNIITKDTAISLGIVITLMGAVAWAADQSARLRTVEDNVQSIPTIQQDIAFIKARLFPIGLADKY